MRERGACTESHTCARASVDVFAVLFVMKCHRESERMRQLNNLDKQLDEQLYGQTMDALFVASNLKNGSNGSFLDLARRIVAFPLLLEVFRMEELLMFLMMVFLGGWLSGVFTCWLFAKMRNMFFPVKSQTDVMIQTDPFIAPGMCDLAVFPRELSIISRDVDMYREGQEMPHF